MNKQEEWAEDVINVLEEIKQVEPRPELFAQINSMLFDKKETKIIPLKQVKWVAAAACLFIIVNGYVFGSNIKSNQENVTQTDESIDILTEYTLYK